MFAQLLVHICTALNGPMGSQVCFAIAGQRDPSQLMLTSGNMSSKHVYLQQTCQAIEALQVVSSMRSTVSINNNHS